MPISFFGRGKQECLPYNDWADVEACRASAPACRVGRQECPPYNCRNSRTVASVRGEEEGNRRNDNAKNAEEGIDPSVE
jgi:hypothetical protein